MQTSESFSGLDFRNLSKRIEVVTPILSFVVRQFRGQSFGKFLVPPAAAIDEKPASGAC
jgi:hypothetical protein